jgi:flagella basal body P-ring formation protein FlgA
MTTSMAMVSALLLPAAGLPVGLAASGGSGGLPWSDGRVVEARVRSLVATRWSVDTTSVGLEWGVVQAPWTPDRDTPLSLEGTGRGGYWLVRFRGEGVDDDDFVLRVRAGLTLRVPVAARRLVRGHRLRHEDIAWSDTLVWGSRAAVADAVAEPGWEVRRLIRKGEPLVPPAVDRPVLVEGGHPVEIFWARGSISLKLEGTAIQSGARGEHVWVRTDTGRRLQGVVDGPGRIVILEAGEDVA